MSDIIKWIFANKKIVSALILLIVFIALCIVVITVVYQGRGLSFGLLKIEEKKVPDVPASEKTVMTTHSPIIVPPTWAPSTDAFSDRQINSVPDVKKDPHFPKLVGNNVEFPAVKLERSTPGFKPGDKFYIAIHENGWDPEEGDKSYEMDRKGDKLIAKGVINQRFHPVLVPRMWHKIELAYGAYLPKRGEFKNNIDYTYPGGPCYCFGPNCVPYSQGGQ